MDNQDDKQEALQGSQRDFVAAWLDALEAAGNEEKDWREKSAKEAVDAYKGVEGSGSEAFNIFHSNIETLVPALYNSSPIPDVRRRFNDDDPVAQQVADLIERAISFSIDDYDFDETMRGVVKDMAVVDRGIARVRYEPTLKPIEPAEEQGEGSQEPTLGHNGGPPMEVEYEEAICEYVPWRSFRRGPATQWRHLPWMAFEHFLAKSEVEKLVAQSDAPAAIKALILGNVRYNYSGDTKTGEGSEAKPAEELPTFGKRARVWEIWDKDTKSVVFITPDYVDYPLAVIPDPLGLKGFFPTPRPAMVIEASDTLTPITSYSIYSKLIVELNDVTRRIAALVAQIRVRGAYAGVSDDIKQIAEALDGEMIALQSAELFATTGGGLDKAILWFPIEPQIQAVKELVAQREVIKQTIYEVTGLSDILRGATNASETATAQNIKTQWGSIRIQSHQKEVERYARDLFRLKAEVMCKHFGIETLEQITGLKFPTEADKQRAQEMKQQGAALVQQFQQASQAAQQSGGQPPEIPPELQQQVQQAGKFLDELLAKPTVEEIEELLHNDRVLAYRVDVESDSTTRADLTKNQEQLKGFLDGTAAFAQAIGPMVQEGVMPGEVAVEIFAAFARVFRLGKQAEDALDKWADDIKKNGIQGKGPDPLAQADAMLKQAQAESHKATAQKTQVETQLLPIQTKAEIDKSQAEFRLNAQDKIMGHRRETAKMGFERQNADRQHQLAEKQHGFAMQQHQDSHGLATRQHEDTHGLAAQQHQDSHGLAVRQTDQADAQMAMADRHKSADLEQADRHQTMGMAQTDAHHEGSMKMEKLKLDKAGQDKGQKPAQGGEDLKASIAALAEAQAQSTQMLAQAIERMTQALSAEKEIVRDPKTGKAVGARTKQQQKD